MMLLNNFATKEREIVHKLDIDNLDDVRVTQDLDEGIDQS